MPTTTNYIWDDQNYLAESDGTNTINVVYTNEPQRYGSLVSTRISGTKSYHHFDANGSTRQFTNTAGHLTDAATYDAWGTVLSRNGTTASPRLWGGESTYYSDTQTGLVWVLERPYGPNVGRWMAADRFPAMILLRYVYAMNAPVFISDPSGLLPWPASVKYTNRRGRFSVAQMTEDYDPPGTKAAVPDDMGSQILLQWTADTDRFIRNWALPEFEPPPECCKCKVLAFAQIITTEKIYWDPWVLTLGFAIHPSRYFLDWHVDQGIPYPKNAPVTVCPVAPGTAVQVKLDDEPGPVPSGKPFAFDNLISFTQEAEACVFCLEGPEASPANIYGCVKWYHHFDQTGTNWRGAATGFSVTRTIANTGATTIVPAKAFYNVLNYGGDEPSQRFKDLFLGWSGWTK